jgi:glycosyltransferase involved in cell wall biosynthesis
VDEDARTLDATARRLGYEVGSADWAPYVRGQAVFLTSHFDALLGPRWMRSSNRLATAYLHGRPGTPGAPEFHAAFDALRREPQRFSRIQVTHAEMREVVLDAGVEPERVFLVPIGVDLACFPLGGTAEKSTARRALGVPAEAFVVGSFQKDGVGWDDGLEPKLIKGPDILVAALQRIRVAVPDLHVLLTGPARGYVRAGLGRLGIPYSHVVAHGSSELSRAYHALDAYLVPSRQEGGPKGALEAMATGAPLVTTRVGQAQEIVETGRNGLVVDVEDVEALADAVVRVHDDEELRRVLVIEGRATAERYANERLDRQWAELLEGFVSRTAA